MAHENLATARARVCSAGELTAEQLVRLDKSELAPPELRAQREAWREKSRASVIVDSSPQQRYIHRGGQAIPIGDSPEVSSTPPSGGLSAAADAAASSASRAAPATARAPPAAPSPREPAAVDSPADGPPVDAVPTALVVDETQPIDPWEDAPFHSREECIVPLGGRADATARGGGDDGGADATGCSGGGGGGGGGAKVSDLGEEEGYDSEATQRGD